MAKVHACICRRGSCRTAANAVANASNSDAKELARASRTGQNFAFVGGAALRAAYGGHGGFAVN